MRIGIYTNRLPYPPVGGIPRFIHELAQAFMLLGIEVEFLVPNLSTNEKEGNPHKNSQSFIEENLARKMPSSLEEILGSSLRDVTLSLSTWINRGPYNQEHIHSFYEKTIDNITETVSSFDYLIIAGSSLLLFNKSPMIEAIIQTNVPTIFVLLFPLAEVEFYLGSLGLALVAEQISNWAKICRYLVVPSKYVEDEVHYHCTINIPIVRISPGINLKDFCSKAQANYESKNVITTSRFSHFTEHKNVESLLQAWPLVRDKVPEATLTLIGSRETSRVKPTQLIFEQEGLLFVGEVSDTEKISLLHKSRVFVLPSSIESFGFSFVEALAAGVPVIGLHSTAVPELVKNGENGLILEPQRTIRKVFKTETIYCKPDIFELSNAIICLLTDSLIYKKLHTNCFSSVKLLDWSNVAKKYLALLSNLEY